MPDVPLTAKRTRCAVPSACGAESRIFGSFDRRSQHRFALAGLAECSGRQRERLFEHAAEHARRKRLEPWIERTRPCRSGSARDQAPAEKSRDFDQIELGLFADFCSRYADAGSGPRPTPAATSVHLLLKAPERGGDIERLRGAIEAVLQARGDSRSRRGRAPSASRGGPSALTRGGRPQLALARRCATGSRASTSPAPGLAAASSRSTSAGIEAALGDGRFECVGSAQLSNVIGPASSGAGRSAARARGRRPRARRRSAATRACASARARRALFSPSAALRTRMHSA